MDIIALLRKYKEQISYLFFGVLTTAVNFVVYFLLRAANLPFEYANAIAIVSAILFAYITNKIWVFESKTEGFTASLLEMLRFFGCRALSAVFDMVSMIVLIDFIHTPELFAKIATAVIVVILNYVFSKLIIFRKS